jgi:pyruvate/2-oxoglutarate dehydrogenase complex dihydrolipoamide acyltransferase (E2) component
MHDVTLFREDFAHEAFLQPLVRRIAAERGVEVELHVRGPGGGASRMLAELSAYVKEIDRGRELLPGILIICRDANCRGYNDRKHEIDPIVQPIAERVVYAIPEPHIERWMLIDPSAFKKAVGKGCQVPGQSVNATTSSGC